MDIALGHYLQEPPNIQTDITERDLQIYNLTLFTGISKYAAWHYLQSSAIIQLNITSKITFNYVTILRTYKSVLQPHP
jgi:hypothetical protein